MAIHDKEYTVICETTEETVVSCYLFTVDLVSRVCPTIETKYVPDEPRLFKSACEPIAIHQRKVGDDEIKLICWFVAAINENETPRQHEEHKFEREFPSYDNAVQNFTFECDRELVKRAIYLVDTTVDQS